MLKYWLEELTNIAVDLEIASEFRYRTVAKKKTSYNCNFSIRRNFRYPRGFKICKTNGKTIISIVNTENSLVGRISDYVLPIMVGPEIGVASTKTFWGN